MILAPGTRLGPYEILAPLGAGGMGEVYRARDTRLSREVAVKVLPADVASDPDRLKRFETEARAASALNHPNIVTIHDIGREGGVSFIALELVEGKTLRELLLEGPLPPKRLMSIAVQAAEGLARAHEAGIVHRDFKPENVMVTKDGFVKVLDFGLAKLRYPDNDAGQPNEAPTIPARTNPGVIMGTVGYMSPEQASGHPVDFRSDHFSFGSVLYEVVTGKRAFSRRTAPETLAAIIREEPEPVSAVAPATSVPLRWIIERCLEKEPGQRYASTKDLVLDLIRGRDQSGDVAPLPNRKRAPSRRWQAGALLVAGVLASIGFFAFVRAAQIPAPPHFHQVTFRHGAVLSARFTPDGQSVAYCAKWEERPPEIFSGRLDSPESRPLDLKATLLSISSTGSLAVLMSSNPNQLAQASLSGGEPRALQEGVFSADWSSDGNDLAVVRWVPSTFVLEFPSGNTLYQTAGSITHPRVSPDGTLVAFAEQPASFGLQSIGVVKRGGKARLLSTGWANISGVAWSPRGDEIWFSAAASGNVEAMRAVSLSGKERIIHEAPEALDLQDISRDGKVLAVHSINRSGVVGCRSGQAERDLTWLDRSEAVDLSGDGGTVLFGESGRGGGKDSSIYVRRTDGSPAVRLGSGTPMALSPDGKWVLALTQSPASLLLVPTGAGKPVSVPRPGLEPLAAPAAFFPDGRRILFAAEEPGHGRRSYVEDLFEGKPRPVTPDGVMAFAVSVDGRFVAGAGPLDLNLWRYPKEGGAREAMSVLIQPRDRPMGWTGDGKSFLLSTSGVPGRVFRVDLKSGARSLWKELIPPDQSGLLAVIPRRISGDGASYVYTYYRQVSDLFLIEGLR